MSLRERIAAAVAQDAVEARPITLTPLQQAQSVVDSLAYWHDVALCRLAEIRVRAAKEELQKTLADYLVVLRSRHTDDEQAAAFARVDTAQIEYEKACNVLRGFQR